MRIAISTEGEFVSAHFGRCPMFTIVDIENGEVIQKQVVENPGHEPGAIPKFLHEKGVHCIIAGGMGMRAQGFFKELGVKPLMGIGGPIETVIDELKKGTLKGGESLCQPGAGKGYGIDKTECDHPEEEKNC